MILMKKLRLRMISFGPTMHFQKHFLEPDFAVPRILKKVKKKFYYERYCFSFRLTYLFIKKPYENSGNCGKLKKCFEKKQALILPESVVEFLEQRLNRRFLFKRGLNKKLFDFYWRFVFGSF